MSAPPLSTPPAPPAAGKPQAIVLLAGACASVLATLVIAPVLPDMKDAFSGTPGIETLVPMAMTLPALGVALLSPVAGRLVDRFGRTRLLHGSMLAYAVLGTAPVWLNSITAILISRALLGAVEAAVMTCCLTLLGDYYDGPTRDRYMSWHPAITAFAAVVFLAVGGALGSSGWRTPFWVYVAALPLMLVMLRVLHEPRPEQPVETDRRAEPIPPLPWRRLAPTLLLSLFGAALVFFTLQAQLSFVLDDLGAGSASIGASAGIANLGVMLSAMVFMRYARRGAAGMLLLAGFVLGALGVFVMSVGSNWLTVTAGALVAGLGSGLLLPALLIGTTARLGFAQRGRGTAAWTSAFYLGQFLSPLLVAALQAGSGDLPSALRLCAVGGLLSALAALLVVRRSPLPVNSTTARDGSHTRPAVEPRPDPAGA